MDQSTQLSVIYQAVADLLGVEPTVLRLFYEGKKLTDRSGTVEHNDIVDGVDLHCVMEQVGDIGTWHTPNNVHPFLLNPPLTPTTSSPPPKDEDLARLVAKLTKGQQEDLTGTTVLDEQLEQVLDPALCEKLRLLLDQRQLAETNGTTNNNTTSNTDFKLYLTYAELCQHIGDIAASALSRRIQDDYTTIVLRRCEPQGDF